MEEIVTLINTASPFGLPQGTPCGLPAHRGEAGACVAAGRLLTRTIRNPLHPTTDPFWNPNQWLMRHQREEFSTGSHQSYGSNIISISRGTQDMPCRLPQDMAYGLPRDKPYGLPRDTTYGLPARRDETGAGRVTLVGRLRHGCWRTGNVPQVLFWAGWVPR